MPSFSIMEGIREVNIAEFFPQIKEEELASDEEKYFVWWLIDLKKQGYVINALHEPTTFDLVDAVTKEYRVEKQLKTKVKIEEGEEQILSSVVYTPDFVIEWSEKAVGIFVTTLDAPGKITYKNNPTMQIVRKRGNSYWGYAEIKPEFDHANMTRYAKIKMIWTYHKHGVFINLCKVGTSFFKKTFTPERYIWNNKNGKRRTLKYKPRGLGEFAFQVQSEKFPD